MKEYTIDYLVCAQGVIERGMFYNYMHSLGYKDHFLLNRYEMVNSVYPFTVCMELKELAIERSATFCYLNDQAGRVKTVEEFKEILERQKT